LKEVGLANRLDHTPRELSGGQSQMVTVAEALANRQSIVIGGEPTRKLDNESSEMVYELLRRLNHVINQTFILATHNMRMAIKKRPHHPAGG